MLSGYSSQRKQFQLMSILDCRHSQWQVQSRIRLMSDHLAKQLERTIPGLKVSTDPAELQFYGNDRTGHWQPEPQLVAFPTDIAQVQALVEFDSDNGSAENRALALFEQCVTSGWIADGVLSQSSTQAISLWEYRELISESTQPHQPYKYDLSVRISQVTRFLAELDALVDEIYPDFEVIWFGHIGDGNLHLNILKPAGMVSAEFEKTCHSVDQLVFNLVKKYRGSISAEHGVGLLKKAWLAHSRSREEISQMRGLRSVFDPAGILNPGKLFD